MPKLKQHHKTKEQIIYEKEQKKLSEARMKFINETFMPVMEGITENIEEAQFIAESIKVAINQRLLQMESEILVKDLGLADSLRKVNKPELVAKHVKVLEALGNQSVKDAVAVLTGLFSASNQFFLDQIKTKKLSDFRKDDSSVRPT